MLATSFSYRCQTLFRLRQLVASTFMSFGSKPISFLFTKQVIIRGILFHNIPIKIIELLLSKKLGQQFLRYLINMNKLLSFWYCVSYLESIVNITKEDKHVMYLNAKLSGHLLQSHHYLYTSHLVRKWEIKDEMKWNKRLSTFIFDELRYQQILQMEINSTEYWILKTQLHLQRLMHD